MLSLNLWKTLSILAALLPVQAAVPTLHKLFDGTYLLDDILALTEGPFGRRSVMGITGGNLSNVEGQLLANVVPGVGGETGVLGSNHVFYPDMRFVFQWVDDGTYVYVELHGSGEFGVRATTYARFETNSTSRAELNGLFTVMKIDLGDLEPIRFEVFTLD